MRVPRTSALGLIVGALAVLSGCSPAAQTGAEPDSGAAASTSAPSSGGGASPAGLAQWQPPVQIQPKTFTEAERRASWEEQRRAALPSGVEESELPMPELVRWVSDDAERWPLVRDCLTEAGFPVELGPLGAGVVYDAVSTAQQASFDAEFYRCASAYPLDPVKNEDWSPEQLSVLYSYWTEYYLPCMQGLGHEYPVETPSESVFRDQAETGPITWWPIEMSMLLQGDALEQAQSQCPAYPPDSALYGSS